MIVKAALFLLVALLLLGMLGKWMRLPSRKRRPPVRSAERCRVCGDYVVGRADACALPDCPHR